MCTRVDLQNIKMIDRFKQNTENAQTNKTKSNIQKHLKQWKHMFVNLFWMPHIWLNLLAFSFFCVFFGVKFMFVYSNCRWFACLFLVPGLGLTGMAICLPKFENVSVTDLGDSFLSLCFILTVMWFSHLLLSSLTPFLEQFSFVSCQTCGWSASVLVWTLLQVLVPKGLAVHDPKTKENKEKERGNMNHEFQRRNMETNWIPKGETHKNRNPTVNKQEKRKKEQHEPK